MPAPRRPPERLPRKPHSHRGAHVLAATLVTLLLAIVYRGDEGPRRPDPQVAPPPAVSAPEVNPWRAAARLVEEDRGEPMGRRASVRVPAQLTHYADRRRFLGIQVAAAREQDYDLPHDEAELAQMIRSGEMVEVPSVGDDYVLYGVGANATGESLRHFDEGSGQEIPLYPRYDLYEDDDRTWAAEVEERQEKLKAAEARLRKTPRAQRKTRTALTREIRGLRSEVSTLQARRKRLAGWYKDYDRRRLLVSEWRELQDMAGRLPGKRRYDLEQPADRRAFRGRMLSYLRPAARDLMLEAAAAYRERFGRPLPVTSLIRTEHYQRQLGETNPNATQIAAPPHTTGLAFDVYYKYMTKDEQETLMEWIADLESKGRLEALRENRDHIHVFVLPEGRPSETLIAESMAVVSGGRPAAAPRAAAARRAAPSGGTARAAARKSGAAVKKKAPARPPAARKAAAPVKRPTPRRQAPRRPAGD
jgi:hypothetical protein